MKYAVPVTLTIDSDSPALAKEIVRRLLNTADHPAMPDDLRYDIGEPGVVESEPFTKPALSKDAVAFIEYVLEDEDLDEGPAFELCDVGFQLSLIAHDFQDFMGFGAGIVGKQRAEQLRADIRRLIDTYGGSTRASLLLPFS